MTAQSETESFLDTLLNEGIKPHAEILAPILESGAIAVVAFEPDDKGKQVLHAAGWNGSAPAFRMRHDFSARLASNTDAVTAAWLRRKSAAGRIFVVIHSGTLLVNWIPGQGFCLEPGSTDGERV